MRVHTVSPAGPRHRGRTIRPRPSLSFVSPRRRQRTAYGGRVRTDRRRDRRRDSPPPHGGPPGGGPLSTLAAAGQHHPTPGRGQPPRRDSGRRPRTVRAGPAHHDRSPAHPDVIVRGGAIRNHPSRHRTWTHSAPDAIPRDGIRPHVRPATPCTRRRPGRPPFVPHGAHGSTIDLPPTPGPLRGEGSRGRPDGGGRGGQGRGGQEPRGSRAEPGRGRGAGAGAARVEPGPPPGVSDSTPTARGEVPVERLGRRKGRGAAAAEGGYGSHLGAFGSPRAAERVPAPGWYGDYLVW